MNVLGNNNLPCCYKFIDDSVMNLNPQNIKVLGDKIG